MVEGTAVGTGAGGGVLVQTPSGDVVEVFQDRPDQPSDPGRIRSIRRSRGGGGGVDAERIEQQRREAQRQQTISSIESEFFQQSRPELRDLSQKQLNQRRQELEQQRENLVSQIETSRRESSPGLRSSSITQLQSELALEEGRNQQPFVEQGSFLDNIRSRARDTLTTEQFKQPIKEEVFQQQFQRSPATIEGFSPSQIEILSTIPGSGVVQLPFTPIEGGKAFGLTATSEEIVLAEQKANLAAQEAFSNLPTLEKTRLKAGDIEFGTVRGGLGLLEETAEFFTDVGGQFGGDTGRTPGFFSEPTIDFGGKFTPDRLETLDVGTSGRVAEFGVGVGVPVVVGGGGALLALRRGTKVSELPGTTARAFSPVKPKAGTFIADDIVETLPDQLIIDDKALTAFRGRGVATPEKASGVLFSKADKTGGLIALERPFGKISQTGKVEFGVQEDLLSVGGKGKVRRAAEVNIGENVLESRQQVDFVGDFVNLRTSQRGKIDVTGVERASPRQNILEVGDVKISRRDVLGASADNVFTAQPTFLDDIRFPKQRTKTVSRINRLEIGNFGPQNLGSVDELGTAIRGSKTSTSSSGNQFDFLLGQAPQAPKPPTNIGDILAQVKQATIPKAPSQPQALPVTGDAFSVLRTQQSEFAGTGQFEISQELVTPPQTIRPRNFFRGDTSFRPVSDTRPAISGIIGAIPDITTRGRTKGRSGIIPTQRNIPRITPIERVDEIVTPVTGQDFFRPEPPGRPGIIPTFGFPSPGRFGFALPGGPPIGRPSARLGRVRGKRRLRRTPSLISVLSGFESPVKLPGEETGLIARPILRRRKKRRSK